MRFLIAVERLIEVAVVRPEKIRPDPARHVAAAGPVLELDHLGTHVGQIGRAIRPRPILLDREDAQPRQRKLHVGAHSAPVAAAIARVRFALRTTGASISLPSTTTSPSGAASNAAITFLA